MKDYIEQIKEIDNTKVLVKYKDKLSFVKHFLEIQLKHIKLCIKEIDKRL